jgi:chromosome segregation ATPase
MVLEKMETETSLDGRLKPTPPAPRDRPEYVRGALVRVYDDDSDEDNGTRNSDVVQGESERLIETTRAMFSTLLDGNSLLDRHSEIEREITSSHLNSQDLLRTAHTLQARIEELEQMQLQASARERELETALCAAQTQLQQMADVDELAVQIEEQLRRASTIHTLLVDAESAISAQSKAAAAALATSKRQAQTAHMQMQKFAKLLDCEKGKGETVSAQLATATAHCDALEHQVQSLEQELQSKNEELELLFRSNQTRQLEQEQKSAQQKAQRGELEDKMAELRGKVDMLTDSRDRLRDKVDAVNEELRAVNEKWDTKWNEENWAKQCAEKQLHEQKRHAKNIESQLADLLKENRELKELVKTMKDSVGLASTIEKIRSVDLSKEKGAQKTVGFDSVLDRVANVRRHVDELEESRHNASNKGDRALLKKKR